MGAVTGGASGVLGCWEGVASPKTSKTRSSNYYPLSFFNTPGPAERVVAWFVVADMTHNITNKTTETPSFSNG
jgi:hypothetical protein